MDDGLREYIEKNSFKSDVIETDFELLMGTIAGLEEKNGKLEKQLAEERLKADALADFAIWMTGCGYDFCQHEYFIKQREALLK